MYNSIFLNFLNFYIITINNITYINIKIINYIKIINFELQLTLIIIIDIIKV